MRLVQKKSNEGKIIVIIKNLRETLIFVSRNTKQFRIKASWLNLYPMQHKNESAKLLKLFFM